MNQQSLKAYLNVIQKLLDCPKGEEWTLLQQHEDLINPELLQVMEQVASELAAEGKLQASKFLRHWEAQLAHVLSQSAHPPSKEDKSQAYLELIQALLDCPKGSETEILAANQALLDPGLVQMMKQVAAQIAVQGNQETANFLGNLAAELQQRLAQTTAFQSRRDKEVKETHGGTDEQIKEIEQLRERLSQLKANLATPEATQLQVPVPQPPPKPKMDLAETASRSEPTTAPSPPQLDLLGIDKRLTAIAESLAKLADILASRLPVPDPLWHMEVLERACAANWIVTTEEVEQLIGVKPQCHAGEHSFQRGCWNFIKVGKIGSHTAWRVTKASVDLPSD
jgi:hypothetical protein